MSASPTKQETGAKEVGFKENSQADAAAKIQAIKRGQQGRAKVAEEKNISKMREDREKAATKLQAIAKGRSARSQVSAASKSSPGGNPCAALVAALSELPVKARECLAPKKPAESAASQLTPALREKVKELFKKLDTDGDGAVSEAEAINFFKSYAKLNARAMLNEVDTDRNGSATCEEMFDFWANVMSTGNYEESELLEELDNILKGEGWTDFDDGRTT